MPTVVNGIGTWYYGKRRIHSIKGTCEFCGGQADLESYDTTLFFVVVFVPLIPLARKRILRQCSACKKHRVTSLAEWEQAKERDGADLLEKLQSNPHDRETAMQAIGFALAYQDEPLLGYIVQTLDGAYAGDAGVQALLGDAYLYFARWDLAEEAYRASLKAQDNEFVREQLAWCLLKQDRPDEAKPYLQHVIGKKKREAAGMVYFLIQSYQAHGRHEEALALMDQRDQAFPDWVALKEYQQQRKTSTRYEGTGKKVRSTLLTGGAGGYREGNWTARLPHWIGGLIVLGALVWYFGAAVWIGQSRKVYLVNGTSKAYTAVVQGTEHLVAAYRAKPIQVAEGDVRMTIKDANVEPVEARIETTFWTRPFASYTFVLNPDQSAIVLEEESYYAKANPRMGAPPKVHFGQAFYNLPGADYEFQEFPHTIQVREHSEVRKTRVALAPFAAPETRLALLQGVERQQQTKLCQRWLRVDPGDALTLYWLCNKLAPDDGIAFLEPRLADLPIRVEWHRMYQTLMERAHPEVDLLPGYQKLLKDANGSADALYLLGRANPDRDEGDKLFRQAASANPPSSFAQYALGYAALCEARFPEAARWIEKAMSLVPDKITMQPMYHDALLANGYYPALLDSLRRDAQVPGRKTFALAQMIRVHAIAGDKVKARQLIDEAVQPVPLQDREKAANAMQALVCCCEKDVDGYLKLADDAFSFEAPLLRGQLKKAANVIITNGLDQGAFRGLLYLEATRTGDKELADNQWNALLAELKKSGRDGRLFADVLEGRKPPSTAQRLLILPTTKRVLLVVLAQRHPGQNEDLLNLARRLDFHRDAISLCLAKYLEKR
jgi:tetratricopeptide (TPR) repeat protein